MKTHYEVLKVGPNAPQELIAESAKALLLLLQPRQNASEAAQQEYLSVARAYKVLSDPLLRAAYDADLHSQPTSNVSSSPAPQTEPVARSAQSKPAYAAQDDGEPSERMAGYGIDPVSLVRVKKGEASLAKTVWYYAVFLPNIIGFAVILAVIFIMVPLGASRDLINIIFSFFTLLGCGYFLFYSLPSVWRSSKHHSVSLFGKYAARALMLLPLISIVLGVLLSMLITSAQRSVSKNSSFTSGDVVQEKRIDLASAVLDEEPVETTAPWEEFPASHAEETPASIFADLEATEPPAISPADAHYNAIYAAHPDADNIVKSGELQAWINTLKHEWRQEYGRVLSEGSTEQVIAMLNSYKTSGYATARLKQNKAASNQAAQYQEPQINSCVYKGVMTKADYDACGITPP